METKARGEIMKDYKGIILAGGSGTRLYPVTKVVSKQLLLIYDKPMIFYSLAVLMMAKIREILLISTPHDLPKFQELLGDGSRFGINLSYKVQPSPDGLAQAFIIAEDFLDGSPSCLILGDNLYYGSDMNSLFERAKSNVGGTVFAYHVKDPERYGVVEFDDKMKAISIEEKPQKPKSPYAVTGLYFYDHNAVEYAKQLTPSPRGELEITDLNLKYLENNNLRVEVLPQGFSWLDTGTVDSMLEASNFIQTIQHRQGVVVACLEEIALANNWISKDELKSSINCKSKSSYEIYVRSLIGM